MKVDQYLLDWDVAYDRYLLAVGRHEPWAESVRQYYETNWGFQRPHTKFPRPDGRCLHCGAHPLRQMAS